MAQERQHPINVSDNPIMRELVEDVFRTRQSRVLRVDDTGAEVEVKPRGAKRTRAAGGKPTAPGGRSRSVVGTGPSAGMEASENHDKYLAGAKKAKRSPLKARPLTEDDALFALVGIGKTGIPSNASEHKLAAFDEAYRKLHNS